jgi:hypothetical protein
MIVMIEGELCSVIPFRVALTKRPTVPAVPSAFRDTSGPVVPLSVPMVPFVMFQEYVVPRGHVALQVGIAVKFCVPPVRSVATAGLTATEVKIGKVMVITAGPPSLVFELSVALTKRPTAPAVLPAVKLTALPELAIKPIAGFVRAQEYAMLEGHVTLQVGMAEKVCAFPETSMAVVGLTKTEVTVGTLTVITAGPPSLVFELSVALTKRPTVPAVMPAVKSTELPEPVKDPIAPLERVQEYEMLEGQVTLHVGLAVKGCAPPETTVAVDGLIATELRTGITIVITAGVPCLVFELSVALTKRPTVPGVPPAVNTTVAPLAPLSEPIALLVSVHE